MKNVKMIVLILNK